MKDHIFNSIQKEDKSKRGSGEVPFSRKDGAVELHKEKGKYRYLSVGGVGQ